MPLQLGDYQQQHRVHLGCRRQDRQSELLLLKHRVVQFHHYRDFRVNPQQSSLPRLCSILPLM